VEGLDKSRFAINFVDSGVKAITLSNGETFNYKIPEDKSEL
jgi:hypothetical protein